jgi:hypothetical protein
MTVYPFSKARQKLASVLDEAEREGSVRIKRPDGREFEVVPVPKEGSPLDVDGADLNLTGEEIVSTLREVRDREAL